MSSGDETKNHHEIVGWRLIREKSLEELKRQAAREGAPFLITKTAEDDLAASGLHAVTSGSTDNITDTAEKSSAPNVAETKKSDKIEDFGEKIGGARKDLAEKTETTSEGNTRLYSTKKVGQNRPYYQIPFAESVDQVISGKYSGDGSIFLRNTPEIFEKIGFARLPFMTTANHVKSIYSPKITVNDHNHNMGESIKDIPDKLEHPLMIITSETHQDTSVVVLIDLTQKIKGVDRQVVVPILVNGRSKVNTIDAHIMTTAQGRVMAISKLAKNALEKEGNGIPSVLYADKKIEPILKSEGIKPPNSFTFDSILHTIADIGIKVKPQNETLQFKQWFGDSKVVEKDGKTPLLVYHGTNAIFNEFDLKYTLQNGATRGNGNHFVVTAISENGRLLAWTHMKASNQYLARQREIEKSCVEKYGGFDRDGKKMNLTYSEYMRLKSDMPLYLATAQATQDSFLQAENLDGINNIVGKNQKSTPTDKKNAKKNGSNRCFWRRKQ